MYRYESFWRKTYNDKTKDSNGKVFPWPTEGEKYWTDKEQFLKKLIGVQNFLKGIKKFTKSEHKDCLLCGQKNITTGTFNLNNIIWEDGWNIIFLNIILDPVQILLIGFINSIPIQNSAKGQ